MCRQINTQSVTFTASCMRVTYQGLRSVFPQTIQPGYPNIQPSWAPTPRVRSSTSHSSPCPHPTPPHRQLPVAPCPPPQLHCAPRRSCWSTGVGPLQWLGMFRFFPHGTQSLPPPLPTPLTSPDPPSLPTTIPNRRTTVFTAVLCGLGWARWTGRHGAGCLGSVR